MLRLKLTMIVKGPLDFISKYNSKIDINLWGVCTEMILSMIMTWMNNHIHVLRRV